MGRKFFRSTRFSTYLWTKFGKGEFSVPDRVFNIIDSASVENLLK